MAVESIGSVPPLPPEQPVTEPEAVREEAPATETAEQSPPPEDQERLVDVFA